MRVAGWTDKALRVALTAVHSVLESIGGSAGRGRLERMRWR